MDQKKIGLFLRELRTEKVLTAEKLNVSGRTVSRWENGNNMPDLSIIVELADFYDIDIRDLLNGERKSEKTNEDLKETLEAVAEYSAVEKKKLTKELYSYTIGTVVLFGMLFIINIFHLTRYYSEFVIFSGLGLVYSASSIVKLCQLTGELSKDSFKKFKIALFIILVILFVIAIFFIMFSSGIFSAGLEV